MVERRRRLKGLVQDFNRSELPALYFEEAEYPEFAGQMTRTDGCEGRLLQAELVDFLGHRLIAVIEQ